jgi:hypothetical protein
MSKSQDRGLWKATFGQISQTLRVLEQLGITLEDLKRLRCDQPFAQRLVAFWKAGVVTGDPIPDSESQSRARAIMGKNFLGLEEVRRGYAIALPVEQLAEIPFSEETLQACKDTHVLVAGSALSVNDVRKLADSDFYDTDWYSREPFANEKKVSVRWYLLRKEPVPESLAKTYNEQIALLKDEEVPFACEITYIVILYWRTHRERLLPYVYVRCQDKGSDGRRVDVGNFTSGTFIVSHYWDGGCNALLGLASSVPPRPARP